MTPYRTLRGMRCPMLGCEHRACVAAALQQMRERCGRDRAPGDSCSSEGPSLRPARRVERAPRRGGFRTSKGTVLRADPVGGRRTCASDGRRPGSNPLLSHKRRSLNTSPARVAHYRSDETHRWELPCRSGFTRRCAGCCLNGRRSEPCVGPDETPKAVLGRAVGRPWGRSGWRDMAAPVVMRLTPGGGQRTG